MQKFSLILAVLCALVFLAGCGGGSSTTTQQPPPPPQAISVTVTPPTADVGAGQTIPFMATVTGDTTGVTWSVNGTAGGNSTVGTIDDTGHFTAPAVTANSTATVTAASKADSTKSASATVTIIAPGVVAATGQRAGGHVHHHSSGNR